MSEGVAINHVASFQLLSGATAGRVALILRALPWIVPVRFRVTGHDGTGFVIRPGVVDGEWSPF